ncbi:MFS transporter, partial [Halorubrum sp. AD140]|uniref:MFS transporter n=1 Tax=Halorubrum sp. AD140 TaxID=3050073 RepID=UPI002ACCCD80
SFLIVVLPLYITSDVVDIEGLLGAEVGVGAAAVTVTEPLLIGVVLSLFGFLNSLSQPFTGRLSDRVGKRRPFVLAGILLLGTASGLYTVATSYPALVALRAIQGLGAAPIIPATVALVNEYAASDTDRGGNFGVYNTFRLIGFGFGPVLAGAVVEAGPYDLSAVGLPVLDGFDAAFVAACAGAYLSFALVFLLVRDADVEGEAGDDVSIRVRGEDRLLDPVFTLGLATVAMGACIALFATLQNQVNVRLDQAPIWFGAQFAAVTIANVIFQVPVGRASDRIGRRPFLVAGFVLLVPTTLLQGVVTEPALMMLVRLGQGIAVACVFAPSLALAGDLAREGESGTTLSVLTMGFGFGVALGPLASGWLVGFGFVVPFAV